MESRLHHPSKKDSTSLNVSLLKLSQSCYETMVTESNINLTRTGTGQPFLVVEVVPNSESTLSEGLWGLLIILLSFTCQSCGQEGGTAVHRKALELFLGPLASMQPP